MRHYKVWKRIFATVTAVCLSVGMIRDFGVTEQISPVYAEDTEEEFVVEEGILIEYNGTAKNVVIPDGVTEIKESVFRENTVIETVEIPETVTKIGSYSFYKCTKLQNVKMGNQVLEIEAYAFSNCSNMTQITLSNNLTTIGNGAFQGCANLKQIEMPDSIEAIGTYVFSNCSDLVKIKMPKDYQRIEKGMFDNCAGLKVINFLEGITEIADYAFYNCDKLTTVPFHENINSIGAYAFFDCDNLSTVEIPCVIGNYAFSNCDTLKTVKLADSVTSMGVYVFDNCKVLSDVALGASLEEIPNGCFKDCNAIKKIIIPGSVKAIQSKAFSNAGNLTEITIPKSVTSIASDAFSNLTSLTVTAVKNSYAQTFAQSNNCIFKELTVSAESIEVLMEDGNTPMPEEIELYVGDCVHPVVCILPLDYTDELIWSSSDTTIADFVEHASDVQKEGICITALKGGTTDLTVSVGNKEFTFRLNVIVPVKTIEIKGYEENASEILSIEVGSSYQLEWTVYPEDATNENVTFRSGCEDVATVDENGLIQFVSTGSVVIYIDSEDGMASASIPFIVKEAVVLELLLGDLDYDENVTLQDANTALRAALGIVVLEQEEIADMNQDGKVDLTDANLILKTALGIKI